MSIDPSQVTQQPTTVETSGPAIVTGPAAITPQTPIGGLIGEAETALIRTPNALLAALGGVLGFLLLVFAYLVVAAVSANNGTAQDYIRAIFGATAVWIVVGVVLVGAAYFAPSPVRSA